MSRGLRVADIYRTQLELDSCLPFAASQLTHKFAETPVLSCHETIDNISADQRTLLGATVPIRPPSPGHIPQYVCVLA